MQSLAWYKNRLRRMSVREVAYRAVKMAGGVLGRLRPIRDVPEPRIPSAPGTRPWTGVTAPLARATGLDYRDARTVGNIKYLRKPNRHLHLVDAGPLGYLSLAAHGHADALAISLSVAGPEFLVDPGTCTYLGWPEWRSHFRGTKAHNTVAVDDQDQSVQGGSFLWFSHARARCLEYHTQDSEDYFKGEHDGYARLRDPVTHTREVRRHGHLFETLDEEPRAGWVSRRFNVKVPAAGARIRFDFQGPANVSTLIECYSGAVVV